MKHFGIILLAAALAVIVAPTASALDVSTPVGDVQDPTASSPDLVTACYGHWAPDPSGYGYSCDGLYVHV
jgi:hypothetical protein